MRKGWRFCQGEENMKKCYCDSCKKLQEFDTDLTELSLIDGIETIHREFCDDCSEKIRDIFKWKFVKDKLNEKEKK